MPRMFLLSHLTHTTGRPHTGGCHHSTVLHNVPHTRLAGGWNNQQRARTVRPHFWQQYMFQVGLLLQYHAGEGGVCMVPDAHFCVACTLLREQSQCGTSQDGCSDESVGA